MTDYISREEVIETIRKAVVYEAIADLVERAINSIPAILTGAEVISWRCRK